MSHPFDVRCYALLQRGVSEGLAHELRWCGNEPLIAEVEAASDADIARLNAEWAQRTT